MAVETAKEVLTDMIMPSVMIDSTKEFILNITKAQADLDRAEADLKLCQDTLLYFQKLRLKYFGVKFE